MSETENVTYHAERLFGHGDGYTLFWKVSGTHSIDVRVYECHAHVVPIHHEPECTFYNKFDGSIHMHVDDNYLHTESEGGMARHILMLAHVHRVCAEYFEKVRTGDKKNYFHKLPLSITVAEEASAGWILDGLNMGPSTLTFSPQDVEQAFNKD